MTPAEKEKKFSEFIQDRVIFIVDYSSASRSRLMKTMIDMGAKATNVKTFKHFDQAVHEINVQKPSVILSDYKLGKRSGFDLLQEHKKYHDENRESLFILVTSNSSQSLVAQAAEEDIDAYILRPYTVESFKEILLNAAIQKLYPSEYILKVEEGKKLLFGGKPGEAMEVFKLAITMHPKPSLAYFYYGQAEKMQEMFDAAEGKYKTGLTFNTIHYKCLTGLFDLLMAENKTDDAYEVVKTISKYFPANPKRLSTVLRLAIMTKNFKDIESFYDIFVDLEVRTDELINYICSAMVILGKFYLMNGEPDKAINVYTNLRNSISGKIKFLLYMIENLVLYGQADKTRDFFKRFDPDTYKTPEYFISDFLSDQWKMDDNEAAKKGVNVIEMKHYNYVVYYIICERFLKLGKQKEAKSYAADAISKFPDRKTFFENLFKFHNVELS